MFKILKNSFFLALLFPLYVFASNPIILNNKTSDDETFVNVIQIYP